jgi:hypothetical protein
MPTSLTVGAGAGMAIGRKPRTSRRQLAVANGGRAAR